MAYIDNLTKWGDMEFTTFTWESIVKASMLYIQANDILGNKPTIKVLQKKKEALTYDKITEISEVPPVWLMVEDFIVAPKEGNLLSKNKVNTIQTHGYFSIPDNEQFISYWKLIEDRLFKIRYGQNIEGIAQSLSLFQPSIDPAALIAALGNGQSLTSAITALSAAVPHYRFSVILQQAKDFTNTVTQLGNALLSALEKKDSEELSLLTTTQGQIISKLTREIKEKDIKVVQEQIKVLEKNRDRAVTQKVHAHTKHLSWIGEGVSLFIRERSMGLKLMASGAFAAAIPGHWVPKSAAGQLEPADSIEALGSSVSLLADVGQSAADLVDQVASNIRNSIEAEFEAAIVGYDKEQLELQIDGAKLQQEIAEKELEIYDRTVVKNQEMERYMRERFTNQELYQWMVEQLSTVYFQTYKLAIDLAQKAEKAFQYELNTTDSYIHFAYWNNLRKGLLAGEGLMLSLQQLEKAHTDNNQRGLEIEKRISLLEIDPIELSKLIKNGTCGFEFSEQLFDYDFPGHYQRQIKSLSITIVADLKPYETIQATLVQTTDRVVLKPSVEAVNFLLGDGDEPTDGSLRTAWRQGQHIAISRRSNNTGLFELDFNDDRYLPFEGTGAVSEWELKLPKGSNRFNLNKISDVIINLQYTAKADDALRENVVKLEKIENYESVRCVNLSEEFPNEWEGFITGQSVNDNKSALTFSLFLANLKKVTKIGDDNKEIVFIAITKDGESIPLKLNEILVADNKVKVTNDKGSPEPKWTITCNKTDVSKLENILLAVPFSGELDWEI
jgi:hypothetical protein